MKESREIRFVRSTDELINFIVPVSGRLSNLVRFLRNWRHIFEADRSLKLIISFAGNSTERK